MNTPTTASQCLLLIFTEMEKVVTQSLLSQMKAVSVNCFLYLKIEVIYIHQTFSCDCRIFSIKRWGRLFKTRPSRPVI